MKKMAVIIAITMMGDLTKPVPSHPSIEMFDKYVEPCEYCGATNEGKRCPICGTYRRPIESDDEQAESWSN